MTKMKKREQKIDVVINFTEGWEERFAKAAYNLYLRIENDEKERSRLEAILTQNARLADKKGVSSIDTLGGKQEMQIVNENG